MKVACSPTIDGIEYNTPPEEQFDGIAELTFETERPSDMVQSCCHSDG